MPNVIPNLYDWFILLLNTNENITKKYILKSTKWKFWGSKTTLVPTDFQHMDKNTNTHRNIFLNIFIGVPQNKVIQVSNNMVSKFIKFLGGGMPFNVDQKHSSCNKWTSVECIENYLNTLVKVCTARVHFEPVVHLDSLWNGFEGISCGLRSC